MDGLPQIPASQLDAPYAERWEILRGVMTRLYVKENKKAKEIVEIMKADYKFYASENQYKRQFGIWGVTKAVPNKKKAAITKTLKTRAQYGKSSMVTYKGEVVEEKKLRRYMKTESRRQSELAWSISTASIDIEHLAGHALQCGNRVFMNWSMPSAVLRSMRSKALDRFSPDAQAGTPHSGIAVFTPSNTAPSPREPEPSVPHITKSGQQEGSGMTMVALDGLKEARANLFIQKDHLALLNGMTLQEQITTTDWMHQFWLFSFKTAGSWGRGPRAWNSTNLKFQEFAPTMLESAPSSPGMSIESPKTQPIHRVAEKRQYALNIEQPSSKCRWSIHFRNPIYVRCASLPAQDLANDPDDENTWKPWPQVETIHDFATLLEKNIESNGFSNIEVRDLPIEVSQIIRAVKRSPEQLLEDAFGFSIMARNRSLVCEMLELIEDDSHFRFHGLYPLHLAASYLDGAQSCCGVFDDIVMSMTTGEITVRKIYVNHLGHTVLDNLMMAILKAHTSVTPVMVDEAFRREGRFAGEEVDICGRWDADSDCIRQLQANGSPIIPKTWKHVFCHTSVQVITHCIGTLFSAHWGPDINTPSGIFLKRCRNEDCGMKMQLMPLHTLVVTGVYLAQLGSDGETLFGIIACLLCLLGKGANPLLKADVSVMALLSDDDNQECSHLSLDPLELAQRVPDDLISKWDQVRKTGWKVFCHVLRLSQSEWRPEPILEGNLTSPIELDSYHGIYSHFIDSSTEGLMADEFRDAIMVHDGDDNVEDQSGDDANTDDRGDDESNYSEEYERDYNKTQGEGLPAYCSWHAHTSFQRNYFRDNKYLATLWAAVQTELLTYRQIDKGDPWISSNFDMESILDSFEARIALRIGLVTKKMMKSFCRCGIFNYSEDVACLRAEEACKFYFSNLEDWSRSTFIEAPENRFQQWEDW